MLALCKNKQKDLSDSIVSALAERTDMTRWKEDQSTRNAGHLAAMKKRLLSEEDRQKKMAKQKKALPQKRTKKFTRRARDRWSEHMQCDSVSPVEVAVICERNDWLERCLGTWKLSGDVITNDCQHVLTSALVRADSIAISMLLERSGIKRFCPTIHGCFDLDGVFVQAYLRTYSEMFHVLNANPITSQECGPFPAFEEAAIKGDFWERSYRQMMIGKPAETGADVSEYQRKILVLNKALEFYMKAVRTKEPVPPMKRCSWTKAEDSSDPIPTADPQSYFSAACGVPELSALIMQMMYLSVRPTVRIDWTRRTQRMRPGFGPQRSSTARCGRATLNW